MTKTNKLSGQAHPSLSPLPRHLSTALTASPPHASYSAPTHSLTHPLYPPTYTSTAEIRYTRETTTSRETVNNVSARLYRVNKPPRDERGLKRRHQNTDTSSDAIKIAQQAIELDRAGDYERAFETYERSLRHFIVALKCTSPHPRTLPYPTPQHDHHPHETTTGSLT